MTLDPKLFDALRGKPVLPPAALAQSTSGAEYPLLTREDRLEYLRDLINGRVTRQVYRRGQLVQEPAVLELRVKALELLMRCERDLDGTPESSRPVTIHLTLPRNGLEPRELPAGIVDAKAE